MGFSARKARVFVPLSAGVFLSDCASKRAAVDHLGPAYVPHDVIGDVLRFTLAFNTSSAMGLFGGPSARWVLAGVATIALITLVGWVSRTTRDSVTLVSGAALIAAGALGNLVDRVRWDRGVVDFIDIGIGATRFWIFNVADVAVLLGAALLWVATRSRGDAPATFRA